MLFIIYCCLYSIYIGIAAELEDKFLRLKDHNIALKHEKLEIENQLKRFVDIHKTFNVSYKHSINFLLISELNGKQLILKKSQMFPNQLMVGTRLKKVRKVKTVSVLIHIASR